MHKFVEERGRSGNPQLDRPSSSSSSSHRRAAAAANAKVQPPKTSLGQQSHPLQSNASHRLPAQPNLQQRQSGESLSGRHDRYGTDASSIDTTINEPSFVKLEEDQQTTRHIPQDRTYAPDINNDDQSSQESEDESGEEESEIEEVAQHPANQMSHQRGGIMGDGNSYPSTTSGPGDDFVNAWNAGVYPGFGAHDLAPSPSSPPKTSMAPPPTMRSAPQQVLQRSSNMAPSSQKMANQGSTMITKSAAIRTNQRGHQQLANTEHWMRGANAYSASSAPIPVQHYQQPAPPVVSAPQPVSMQRPAIVVDGRVQAGPSHAQPLRQTAPVVSSVALDPPHFKEEPHPNSQPGEALQEHVFLPVEDYDHEELFKMSYDQLKHEDFDTVPRGIPKVLSADMDQRPLPERLEHVKQSLNVHDQDKFFRSLPTREWEEAGDWFLDRFSSIIERTKQARQKKRKLARDFEDAIEERFRQVAKRQLQSETALEKMQAQGQSLLPPKTPKTPRSSKSPRARKT